MISVALPSPWSADENQLLPSASCAQSCSAHSLLPPEIHFEHSYFLFLFPPNPAEMNWPKEQIPFWSKSMKENIPEALKLWQPEAAQSIGGFARRKCSSSDAKSASLMPAALLSVISAWQLLQDPCLVLFLGFIPAFQLSGPLCTCYDSIGNIMYVLAWVFLKELALV